MNLIAPDHPLSRSLWLWPHGNIYLENSYAQFRHDFKLTAVPEKAPLYITADQFYRLYVNGRYVCRGPARGYQSHWPCDEVEVSAYLHEGENFIAVEAYNPGIGTFQYLHQSAAGFLCAAEWEGASIHTSKATWRMRRAPGNNSRVARLSRQMGFQEDFDASRDDSSWITSPTPPEWREEVCYRWAGEASFGRPPWDTLEERGIPLLREEIVVPERITVHGTGRMEPGWEGAFNIAWQWMEKEAFGVREWLPGSALNASRDEKGLSFTVTPAGEGEFRAVVVDLGAIRVGTFGVEAFGCAGGEIIDCLYYQYLDGGVPVDLIPVGNGGLIALASRMRTAPGDCGRMFYQLQGARYIVLVLRNLTRPIRLLTCWRTAEYPFSMRGRFETSDALLNDIYALCRHTQQICSIDAYVDTPWREQGQWWGDARVQAKNTFFLDGDDRLLRRGIDSIAGQESREGVTYGVAPCCTGCILPDFSLTWVLTLFDLYWQTGDLAPFLAHHDRVRKIFAYFESPAARDIDGLLRYDPRYWLFEDWAPLFKAGKPAFLNLWHLYTLEHYEKLLAAAGFTAEQASTALEVRERKELIENNFFDVSSGLFIGGLKDDGTPCDEPPSLHDQVLAILCGLKPEFHPGMIEKRLLPFLRGEKTDFATPTSFWCTYLFDAAKLLGLNREVLEFIRNHWAKMIPAGGAWEHFIWDRNDGQSCCHAWSAHPVSHLVELLGGIRQLAPGWKELECRPNPELLPEHGVIRLSLPPGDLILEWNHGAIHLTPPPNCLIRR